MKNSFFENIREVFLENFRVTRLYAAYLEHYPEIISPELIEDMASEGIQKKDAIVGLLCEIFGLDVERSDKDRRLVREYLSPSVKILDAEKYENNPYYKNVPLKNATLGNWEIKIESYPAYRGVIAGDMIIKRDFTEIPPLCFFENEFKFPAVLEGGNEWMTLTPVDLDTCEDAIERARGDVITFGLGLGYYAYMVARKPEVRSITVVEKNPDVIRLFKEQILPYFENTEKLTVIEADAFEYAEEQMPKRHFDLAFVDTWRDAGDGSEMYRKMKQYEGLNQGTEFLYWIEGFIISRLRALRFSELNEKYEAGELNMTKEEIISELTDIEKLIR